MEIREVHKEDAWTLRHEVMWPDREPEYVRLADDDQARHYGLFEDGRLQSVVSLFIQEQEAQFRKFATRREMQGKGYGSTLLRHVLKEAEQLGVQRIYCNARSGKTGFYRRFGLEETGEVFSRGGREYKLMELLFAAPDEQEDVSR